MRSELFLLVAVIPYVLANNNGLGRYPVMGWSTWCTMGSCGQPPPPPSPGIQTQQSYHDVCYEWEILEVAAAMVANGMQKVGFQYLEIDDCWAADTRDAQGRLQGDPARFPNGMASFIAKAHSMGFKVGLYTSAGAQTCSSGGRPHPIPGSYGHYQLDANTFAEWGADMVRMDYCDWHFNTTVLIPGVQTKEMHDALNKTGRPMWFYFHCIPIPPDISWCGEYGNSFGIWMDHHDQWSSTADIIHHLKKPWWFAGPYAWPDPDFLMTGGAGCNNATAGMRCPGQTDNEYRSEFSIWSLAGGQMLIAADVRNMSALQQQILLNTEILAVYNDPLGKLGEMISNDTRVEYSVWARQLHTGCAAVALLNEASKPVDITVEFSAIPRMGWNKGTSLAVRDLWAHAPVGTFQGSYTAKAVDVHDTAFLTVCPTKSV